MISVTRLDGQSLIVNADLIETIEETPDTIISLTTGQKLIVRESLRQVTDRVMDYRRAVFGALERAVRAEGARAVPRDGKMSVRKRFRVDVASFLGVPVSLGLILLGQAWEGGSVASLLQPTAALIVFGGTFGALLLAFSRNDILHAVRSVRTVFLWDGEPPSQTIQVMVQLAKQARVTGILSLENELPQLHDRYLRKAVGLAVDAANATLMRDMLEIENRSLEDHDETPARVFEAAGGYAPTVGILGAVIGLIQTMQHLTDPTKLGTGIAVAFVATVYGVGSANLLFLPAATKLRTKARHEGRRRELMIEGILAIRDGMFPNMVEQRLSGFAAQAAPPEQPIRGK